MIFYEDWAGWILFFVIYILFLVSRTTRSSKRVFYAGVFAITLHQVITITNTYIVKLPGANSDAVRFHRDASFIANELSIDLLNVGSHFYNNFLALFYKFLGDSLFLGSQLSILSFMLSLIVILKISKELNLNFIIQKYIVLFFGMVPSVLINTSVTLRESFQILILLLICYYAIRAKKTKRKRYLLSSIFFIVFFSFWHNGFVALSPFLVFITIYWVFKTNKMSAVNSLGFMAGASIMGFAFLLLSTGVISSPAFEALMSGDADEYASTYRAKSNLDARAYYGGELDTSSIFGFITTFPVVVFNYFVAPLPWQIGSPMDLVTVMENVIRFWLIRGAIKAIKRTEGLEKSILKFLIFVYLLVEIMWSTGTVNWGTAMRHHVVAFALLIVVGGKESFKVFIKEKKPVPKIQRFVKASD